MKLRNILFGKYREKVLGNIICNEIEKLKDLNKKKKITIIRRKQDLLKLINN